MTDPRNAQPGSYGTSGYAAGAGEESRMAANSGRASVRPKRPGAASPAGWFSPPAGEAAPPVRLREPARSDGASQYAVETRPTSMYRVPWQTARQERIRRSLGRLQAPMAPARGSAPADHKPDNSASLGTPPDPRAGAPDMHWPSLTRRGPLHIPVVGPTEALRGRAGGPGVDVPPRAVPSLLDRERQSGWQLAQRVWQDSGVNWEDAPAPPQSDNEAPNPYAPDPYAPDPNAPDPNAPDPYADDRTRYPTDPHPTRPDLPVLAAPADSRHGMGPWPVQPPPEAPWLEPPVVEREPGEPGEQEDPEPEDRDQGPQDRGGQAPPLPRRAPPRSREFGPSAFAPSSPFAPSPAFAARQSFGPSPALDESPALSGSPALAGFLASGQAPLSAPVAEAAPPLGEPDELFRAWQGSVREAAGRGTPWTARRPAGGVARRGLGWQVAKIGVPAAVIVTVGAGALMILTGRANEMLAERASSGALSAGQPRAGAVSPGGASGKATATGQAGAGATGLTLAGYPGQHGSVGVAALWSAGGTTMAVGHADAHPAVWRHATDGTWSLVSTAALGGLTGHLTSVAQGPSGWIAVGSMNENGTVEPVVFWSPDGVTWTPQAALTNFAGSSAQFLGVAAGPGGYLVVGKDGSDDQASVALWWSADLKNWANGETSGSAGSFAAAAVAVGNGFVAAGSENNCHTIWTSPDGRNWTAHDLAKPSGATTAALRSVAADQGGRFVAAGYATNSAGDLPIVVTSADGGAHVTQVVLGAQQGQATVTAVTATGDGFAAVGLAGPAGAQHAVEWTSPDGVTWSPATQLTAAGNSEVTALTDSGTTVTGTAQRATDPSVLTVPAP
jgi:hypothetical protein